MGVGGRVKEVHHLIPTIVLVPLIFAWLAKMIGARRAYWTLCGAPYCFFLLALLAESWFGYGIVEHGLFHLSYDTSYILTLIGLLLSLYVVFKDGRRDCLGRRPIELMSAIVLAVVPLLHLLLW
jgi:hypothetical protein